jgi:hypothetical protein
MRDIEELGEFHEGHAVLDAVDDTLDASSTRTLGGFKIGGSSLRQTSTHGKVVRNHADWISRLLLP